MTRCLPRGRQIANHSTMKLRRDAPKIRRRFKFLPPYFAVFAFAIIFASRTFAQPESSGQFAIETWQTDNGLPQNSVTDVFQSKDGYIYAGTYNGLARFDGVRFVIYDSVNTPRSKTAVSPACTRTKLGSFGSAMKRRCVLAGSRSVSQPGPGNQLARRRDCGFRFRR